MNKAPRYLQFEAKTDHPLTRGSSTFFWMRTMKTKPKNTKEPTLIMATLHSPEKLLL